MSLTRRELLLGLGATLALEACSSSQKPQVPPTPTRIPYPGMPFKTDAQQVRTLPKPERLQIMPAERTPISANTVEFYSNGAILNLDSQRLELVADPVQLNNIMKGLNLPENFVIATIITPLRPSPQNSGALYASIPPTLEGKLHAQFPKALARSQYNVNFISTSEAVEAVLRPQLQARGSYEVNPSDIARKISVQLSKMWFLSVRDQYENVNNIPHTSRSVPTEVDKMIEQNPPIKVSAVSGTFSG